MRERFTITVTDYRGARHFSLRHVVKAYAALLGGGLGAMLLLGGAFIYFLNFKIDQLNTEIVSLEQTRGEIMDNYAKVVDERVRLVEMVELKSTELAEVNNELGVIEAMIGLHPNDNADLKARLDTAGQTAMEKTLMLQLIPSGSPVEYKGLSSSFGWREHPIYKERRFHAGIDLRGKTGDPVYATADGVIEWAAFHKSSGFGKLIIIHHSFGFNSYYGHLSDITVKPGEFVKRGQLIGRIGQTGATDGPHLHYEVRHIHRRLNPKTFVEWSLDKYDSIFEQEGHVQWDSLAEAVRERLAIPERRLSQRALTSRDS